MFSVKIKKHINKHFFKRNLRNIIFYPLALAVFILLSIYASGFISVRNLTNILKQQSVLGLLVLGIYPVLLIKQIDLSIAAVMTSSTIIGGVIIQITGNVALGISSIIVAGVLIGLINGLIVGKLRVFSFIATLSIMIIGSGIAAIYGQSGFVTSFPEEYVFVGQKVLLGFIPFQLLIYLFVIIIVSIFMTRHYIGKLISYIGLNQKACELSGVPVALITIGIFIFSGLMGSLAGLIQTAQLGTASASIGRESVVLDYITAATIGGISLSGGKGTVSNAVLGTFILVLFLNAINLLGIDYYTSLVIKGILILVVISIDSLQNR